MTKDIGKGMKIGEVFSVWRCECGKEYDTLEEAENCEKKHKIKRDVK